MNKTIIIGRLTKDIELKTLSNTGTAIVNNTIATSRVKNNQNGERIEETLFLDIVAFNRTAEVMSQYLRKGSKLALEGYLQQQTWVDNQTGQNRSKIVLIIENMEMLDNKQDNQNNTQGSYQNNYQQPRQNNNYHQQPRQNQVNNYQQPQQNYQNNNYQQGGADELPW